MWEEWTLFEGTNSKRVGEPNNSAVQVLNVSCVFVSFDSFDKSSHGTYLFNYCPNRANVRGIVAFVQ